MRLHDTIRSSRQARHEVGLRARLAKATVPLICISIMVYFGYHAVEGNHGLRRLIEKQDESARLEAQLAAATETRERLEHDVALMRPESLDPDLLDERARAALGFAHPDELTIFIDE